MVILILHLGHNFELCPGSYGYHYLCNKCNSDIIFDNRYFIVGTGFNVEVLSCAEEIIKGIIE